MAILFPITNGGTDPAFFGMHCTCGMLEDLCTAEIGFSKERLGSEQSTDEL